MKVYICGRRGAGKSTVAAILAERLDAKVVRAADPIYEVAQSYFGMREKNRLLLQRVGDAFRAVDPAWIAKHAAWRAACRVGPGGVAVIEGIRTLDDCLYLNREGWIGLLVQAPEAARLSRRAGEPPEVDLHPTEAGVDCLPVAVVLENSGSLEDLERAVLGAVAPWRGEIAANA